MLALIVVGAVLSAGKTAHAAFTEAYFLNPSSDGTFIYYEPPEGLPVLASYNTRISFYLGTYDNGLTIANSSSGFNYGDNFYFGDLNTLNNGTDGNYYATIQICNNSLCDDAIYAEEYIVWNKTGSVFTYNSPTFDYGTSDEQSSALQVITPVLDSIDNDNNVDFQIDWDEEYNFDVIQIHVTNLLDSEFYTDQSTVTNLQTTNFNINPLPTGSYELDALGCYYVQGSFDYDCPARVDNHYFHVVENSYQTLTGFSNPTVQNSDLSQIDCSTFEVGCQMQKAMSFLFKPSFASLNQFSQFNTLLETKKPFGYFLLAKNKLTDLQIQEAGMTDFTINAGVLGELTLMDWDEAVNQFGSYPKDFANQLMTYSAWFGLIFYMYNRMKNIYRV